MCSFIWIIAVSFFLTACSASSPLWRDSAAIAVEELGRQEAAKLFPQEYYNLVETFEHGEAMLHVYDNSRDADPYYLLVLQKSVVLRAELLASKERMAAAAEAEKAAQIAKDRALRDAAELEARLAAQERLNKEALTRAAIAARARQNSQEPTLILPSLYTVRRGETLPQIAARTEIYDDASLWPIIYRANRDQIRNPRQLWPGQKLKIPRNFSRDDITEAKRYSGRK